MVNEEKEVDLDGDGVADVFLKLNSISEANVAVNLELSEIVIEDINVVVGNEVEVDVDESEEENIESVSYMGYILGLIVAILLLIFLFLFFKKSSKFGKYLGRK